MYTSMIGVDASIVTDSLQIKAAQGSRSWRRLIEESIAAYQLITPGWFTIIHWFFLICAWSCIGVTIDLTSWTSTYEPPSLTTTSGQLARNL
jgi:hypothetical protein